MAQLSQQPLPSYFAEIMRGIDKSAIISQVRSTFPKTTTDCPDNALIEESISLLIEYLVIFTVNNPDKRFDLKDEEQFNSLTSKWKEIFPNLKRKLSYTQRFVENELPSIKKLAENFAAEQDDASIQLEQIVRLHVARAVHGVATYFEQIPPPKVNEALYADDIMNFFEPYANMSMDLSRY